MTLRVTKARLGFAPMQKRLTKFIAPLLMAASAALSAAPVGYSINSDSITSEPDSLYTINLSTGQIIERIGLVNLPPLLDGRRLDVEGLAFAPDGTLYGIDDESLKLFRINPTNALVDPDQDYPVTGGGLTPQNNDFGMTFGCDGTLYASSISQDALYEIDLTGANTATASKIGTLGVKIGALAAYGSPTVLYGLSNGVLGTNAAGPPHLYTINTETGETTDLGLLGGSFQDYAEAGLSFDESGNLWAITDRSSEALSSQVMRINTTNLMVEESHITTEQGFESLAISTPRGCTSAPSAEFATFVVRKQFADGNRETPSTYNFKCTSGTVTNPSRTIFPDQIGFGPHQISFVVDNLPAGQVECEIEEVPLAGYTPSYECESESSCSTNESVGPCTFQSVSDGQQGLCLVSNELDPVELTVTKEWLYSRDEEEQFDRANIYLYCANVFDGDGDSDGNIMRWDWPFEGNPASQVAIVYPNYDGSTECWTEEYNTASAVESESTCDEPISILVGDSERSCLVINTVFFEGIPTLNPIGLALISALLLMTGLVSLRRYG
jgi:hypothetical protein